MYKPMLLKYLISALLTIILNGEHLMCYIFENISLDAVMNSSVYVALTYYHEDISLLKWNLPLSV